MAVNIKGALKVLCYMYDNTEYNAGIDFPAVRKKFSKLAEEDYQEILRYLRSEHLIGTNGNIITDKEGNEIDELSVVVKNARPLLFELATEINEKNNERAWQVVLLVISSVLSLVGGFILGWFSRGQTIKP